MRTLVARLFLSASLAAAAAPAFAGSVAIPMDEVRIVSFSQPASSVYLGNPTVADVTTIDSKHVFLLGKSFGTTNLIALDAAGKPIANDRITVFGPRAGVVTLNKGAEQYNYTCTAAHCEAAPVPGDATTYHSNTISEIGAEEAQNLKSASATH